MEMSIKVRENQPSAEVCETSKKALIDRRCQNLNFAINENSVLISRLTDILRYSPTVAQQEEECGTVSNLSQFLEVSVHELEICNKNLNGLIQDLLNQVGEIKIL